MVRRIIQIDEGRCNGCGACAAACHEGAIEMVNGKAVLTREDYCDGLGDCLPECPAGAIRFEEREAPAYDEAAVRAAKQKKEPSEKPCPAGCPGTQARAVQCVQADALHFPTAAASRLAQWPCQIKLAPVAAPFFHGAELLIAADCTAYAYAGIHEDFMKGKVTLIGCPKLDAVDYSEKLAAIFQNNAIQSITLLRMEVPCCAGLVLAAQKALKASGRRLPWQTVTVSIKGEILKREEEIPDVQKH